MCSFEKPQLTSDDFSCVHHGAPITLRANSSHRRSLLMIKINGKALSLFSAGGSFSDFGVYYVLCTYVPVKEATIQIEVYQKL